MKINVLWKNIRFVFLALAFIYFYTDCVFGHSPHDQIYEVELSPAYSQDKTLFITVRHNLLKSEDGGKNWIRLTNGLDYRCFLGSLAISNQTKNVLYLSTIADWQAINPLWWGDGIYKSVDAGASWQKVNNGLKTLSIDLIAVSPHSDKTVFAAGEKGGLYKTEDGAKTWQQVVSDDNKITAIGFFPEDGDRMIIGNNSGAIYISNDKGETWKKKFVFKGKGTIKGIAISPFFSKDDTFFVVIKRKGIFKTMDGGRSFKVSNKGLPDISVQDIITIPTEKNKFSIYQSTWQEGVFYSKDSGGNWIESSKGLSCEPQADQWKVPHFTDIEASDKFKQDKTLFLAGFDGLFKSQNSGLSWRQLDTLTGEVITGLAISPDYRNDSTLATVCYGNRAYISRDKGNTWVPMKRGLEIPRFTRSFRKEKSNVLRFYDIVFSPDYAKDKTIFATLLWTKVLKSTDEGKTWKIISLPKEERGIAIAVSPNFSHDNTVFVVSNRGIIFKSNDRGESFSIVGETGEPINLAVSLAISPSYSEDKTLYTTSIINIFKSIDGGKNWRSITSGTAIEKVGNIKLAISPNYKDDQTVIAGTGEGIFITKDAGRTWGKLENNKHVSEGFIEGVAISPDYKNDNTFIVSVQGKGLFKTADRGQTFFSLGDKSIPLSRMNRVPSGSMPIQFSPDYALDKTIYGFGSAKTEVFKSTDGGYNWEILKLPEYPVYQYGFITYIVLFFKIYHREILKLLAGAIIFMFLYLTLWWVSK